MGQKKYTKDTQFLVEGEIRLKAVKGPSSNAKRERKRRMLSVQNQLRKFTFTASLGPSSRIGIV